MKASRPLRRRCTGPERKAGILAAASSLFAAKGFNGTKTREIAKQAGVSEALIFRHFASKKALYAAILTEQSPIPELLSELKKLAHQRQDVQVLTHIAQTIVRKAPAPPLMRLLLFSALENHELAKIFAEQHLQQFYDFLAGYIAQRIRDGAFRRVDPLLAARSFIGMLIYHRLLSHLFHMPVPQQPDEIVQTFVTIFVNGLHKPKKRRKRAGNQIGPHTESMRP